ncbi:MAG: GPP34 family phosphoprotein, partial [Pseudomonadota bacterium]
MLTRTLSLPEELLLLLLNPESGKLEIKDRVAMQAALGGAVLLELSLLGRIDTDLTHITLIDDTNASEELGPAEAYVYRRLFGDQDLSIRHWVYETYQYFDLLQDMLMSRMINNGMISRRTKSYFGLFKKQRYVLAESAAQRDVKRRLMTVLFSDDIPNSR